GMQDVGHHATGVRGDGLLHAGDRVFDVAAQLRGCPLEMLEARGIGARNFVTVPVLHFLLTSTFTWLIIRSRRSPAAGPAIRESNVGRRPGRGNARAAGSPARSAALTGDRPWMRCPTFSVSSA